LARHRQMFSARADVVTLYHPSGTEVALRTDLEPVVVRNFPFSRYDCSDRESEASGRATRRSCRRDETARWDRIREISQKRRAIVVGRDDAGRLRESELIAGVEVIVIAEKPGASANHGLVIEHVGE